MGWVRHWASFLEAVQKSTDMNFGLELVARIQAGDRSGERELVERYGQAVAILLRRAGRTEVEDLFQETFRIIIEKLRNREIREPEKLSGFVCSIARNLASDYIRRGIRIRNEHPIETTSAIHHPALSPLDGLVRKENAELVRRILDELKHERDREVLYRFYLAEQDKTDICKELQLTSLQFDQVIFRARERYRILYERRMLKNQPADRM